MFPPCYGSYILDGTALALCGDAERYGALVDELADYFDAEVVTGGIRHEIAAAIISGYVKKFSPTGRPVE